MSAGRRAHVGLRRRDAMRLLLRPYHLRDSLALSAQSTGGDALAAGLQAAAAALVVLPLALLSPWPHLVGFAALGALVALFGRFAPASERRGIVLRAGLCQIAAVAIMSAAAWLGLPIELQLVLLALLCGLFFLVCELGRFGAPGPLILVFAASAALAPTLAAAEMVERVAATAVAAAVAWLVCALSDPARRRPASARPAAGHVPHLRVAALRIVAGTAIAGLAAHAAGAAHPGWAAMGALAVLQAPQLHIALHRAVQRMGGTAIGALLVGVVLAMEPSTWTVIAILAMAQVATEVVIGRNYAIGQILVTPMALLMTALAAPTAAGIAMVTERVCDTVAGALIGLMMLVLLSSSTDRARLQRHHAERTLSRP